MLMNWNNFIHYSGVVMCEHARTANISKRVSTGNSQWFQFLSSTSTASTTITNIKAPVAFMTEP